MQERQAAELAQRELERLRGKGRRFFAGPRLSADDLLEASDDLGLTMPDESRLFLIGHRRMRFKVSRQELVGLETVDQARKLIQGKVDLLKT